MSFLSKLLSFEEENTTVSAAGPAAAAGSPAPADGGELIAVITAAIMAFEGGAPVDGLTVRRIRRAQDQIPTWCRAGLSDCMDSRKM